MFRYYPEIKVSGSVSGMCGFRSQKQLSDFGSGRLTHPLEPYHTNPDVYRRDPHTRGCDAPESDNGRWVPGRPRFQLQALEMATGNLPKRMLSKMNIWQIGRTILNMMRLELSPTEYIDVYTVPRVTGPAVGQLVPTDSWVPNADTSLAKKYSKRLRTLVNDCLQADPDHRPTPTEVKRRCTTHISAYWRAHRDRPANQPYGNTSHHRLRLNTAERTRRFRLAKRSPRGAPIRP